METAGTTIGSYAPDFELPGTDNAVHHLARYLERSKSVGVVFMCNHCPYVRLYLDRLKKIQATFQAQKFTLIGINANDATQYPDDSFENMKHFAVEQQLNFPYLRDVTQDVARSFGVKTTPEVFLLDQAGIVRYHGRIDDNPEDASAVRSPNFQIAIARVLEGASVPVPATEPVGCSVKWRT
jgi:peroxiredoxin